MGQSFYSAGDSCLGHWFVVLAAVLLVHNLAACGGGGGSSKVETITSTPAFGQGTVDKQSRQGSMEQAATTFPAFGSVTQSSNSMDSGGSADCTGSPCSDTPGHLVSTDTASTTFTGDRFTLTVTRENDSPLVFDTATDEAEQSMPGLSPVTGRQSQIGTIVDAAADSLAAAVTFVDWSSTDTTDYLAGGYWLYVGIDLEAGNLAEVEIGAFVDGPELSGSVNMPVSGTASYSGITGGVYATKYGTDLPRGSAGSYGAGEYLGNIYLTANFDTSSISGMIDHINLYGSYLETPSGTLQTLDDYPQSGYQVMLDSLSIAENGSFRGTGVRLAHPGLRMTHTDGAWGGKFSTLDDSSGNPRMVAGTYGGTARTSGASEVAFIGAFYGSTELLENRPVQPANAPPMMPAPGN